MFVYIYIHTLQERNIPQLGKGKIIFPQKCRLVGDMLVPGRVYDIIKIYIYIYDYVCTLYMDYIHDSLVGGTFSVHMFVLVQIFVGERFGDRIIHLFVGK